MAIPDTKPVADIVATAVLLLLHVAPVVALLSNEVDPRHNEVAPVITAGLAFTVTAAIELQPVAVV
jgi:hypothetical protein